MFYCLLKDVIFRKYNDFGYITDNSMFGYHFLDEESSLPGEKFFSESGSIMINELSYTPQNIDDIVNSLLTIFEGVEFNELKNDTIEFYTNFVSDGFLACGETFEECSDYKRKKVIKAECATNIFGTESFQNKKLDNLIKSLHIEIVNECNERCVHCYIPHYLKNKILDSDLFYDIIEQGRKLNIINVTISGGEPLLHKDFLGFLKKCRELNLSVNILSNLTLLDDEIIEEMKRNPLLSVQTSIYSMHPEVHDNITKKAGSLVKTLESVCKLISKGIPVQISCPIMKQNKTDFMEVVKWGKNKNISVLTDYIIFATYDHSNSNLVNRLSLDEVEHAFKMQLSEAYAKEIKDNASKKENLSENEPVCSICRYFFCISAEGNVFPCVGWQSKIIGNVRNQKIKDLWEKSEEANKLRNVKRKQFPKCLVCKNRGYCTICMMSNSNESKEGDIFKIEKYHCDVASLIHKNTDIYLSKKNSF